MAKKILTYTVSKKTSKGKKNVIRRKQIILPPSATIVKILGPGLYKKHTGKNVYGIKIKYKSNMGKLLAMRRKVIELPKKVRQKPKIN